MCVFDRLAVALNSIQRMTASRFANRSELVSLEKPGVTIYGWHASLVGCPRMGHFP
jgi:hypothetical protein